VLFMDFALKLNVDISNTPDAMPFLENVLQTSGNDLLQYLRFQSAKLRYFVSIPHTDHSL